MARAGRPSAQPKSTKTSADTRLFEHALVLQSFLAGRLGASVLDPKSAAYPVLRRVTWEYDAASGGSAYLSALKPFRSAIPGVAMCDADELVRHDAQIHLIQEAMNEIPRENPVRWQYYLWVALMHSAIYLDAYFADPEALRTALNLHVSDFNRDRELALPDYTEHDLRKLSMWLATGSGKTLLFHANLRQVRYYSELHGKSIGRNPLLIVPSEALAKQHVSELQQSGLPARIFDRSMRPSPMTAHFVLVLIITNLYPPPDSTRHKRPAASADAISYGPELFQQDNLIFVDEGHKGEKEDGVWRSIRNWLGAKGLTFEYSATFKEIVREGIPKLRTAVAAKSADTDEDDAALDVGTLARHYARNIAIDYAFPRFHKDGYGKHYQVLALKAKLEEQEKFDVYLCGCLLAFYEQCLVFESDTPLAQAHKIERPLAVFAGARVTGEHSEVVESLRFFGRFLTSRATFEPILGRLLAEELMCKVVRKGVVENVFKGMFRQCQIRWKTDHSGLYNDIVHRVFLASVANKLTVEPLKEAKGEIAISVAGSGLPFGVVNVSEANVKPLTDVLLLPGNSAWVQVASARTGPSLFGTLDNQNSRLTVLVGSQKFMEGWNCFRVSMLGVHNMGKSPGARIIQLFGRGVRLRGKDGLLKRTSPDSKTALGDSVHGPLRVLETLSLFTVNAEYLSVFDGEVEEAISGGESAPEPLSIPIVGDKSPPHLRVLRIPTDKQFRESQAVVEVGPATQRENAPYIDVFLDYYALATRTGSSGTESSESAARQHQIVQPPFGFALLDHDALYLAMARLRVEKQWYNLKLPRFVDVSGSPEPLSAWILQQKGWFTVAIEERLVAIAEGVTPLRLALWQRLATDLVCAYVERAYDYRRRTWKTANAEVRWWDELNQGDRDDLVPEGLFGGKPAYSVTVYGDPDDAAVSDVVMFVRDIAAEQEANGKWPQGENGMRAWRPPASFYRPLLALNEHPKPKVSVRIFPAPLNPGEEGFVRDLEKYAASGPELLAGAKITVLRNESRRGIGFFVGVGFYPDFIVWVERGAKQWVIFVDPKGLAHGATINTAKKLDLPPVLWKIEKRAALPDLRLDAFIVSVTPKQVLNPAWLASLGVAGERVVFADQPAYIETMLSRALSRV